MTIYSTSFYFNIYIFHGQIYENFEIYVGSKYTVFQIFSKSNNSIDILDGNVSKNGT